MSPTSNRRDVVCFCACVGCRCGRLYYVELSTSVCQRLLRIWPSCLIFEFRFDDAIERDQSQVRRRGLALDA